ncbi:MAG: UvrD-helicase domain-containing protein [Chloroflexi bacterium]|nr:UvrD-helicase domain-containing protein [Chloroflexota bacterium]
MNELLRNKVLTTFELTQTQREAAGERARDVAVTAGAGSGKTKTLVARYTSLLADGVDLRRVVAITFSDKVAREMRSRVREALDELIADASGEEEPILWSDLKAKMDSARISTIHSLCAEMLRAHPVEAVVDPRFEVLEEGEQLAIAKQVVADTMVELVSSALFDPLFRLMKTDEVSKLLSFLLNKRLDVREAFESGLDPEKRICQALEILLQDPSIVESIKALQGFTEHDLYADAGDRLGSQVETLLGLWSQAEKHLAASDYIACAGSLFEARRNHMNLRIGPKGSGAKEILKVLQELYDQILHPICGGKNPADEPPGVEAEVNFGLALDLVRQAFDLLHERYREVLTKRSALDFDDLEGGAAKLLEIPQVRKLWQEQIDALLVDEFQDTNKRQLAIVRGLAGSEGRLFVVGDAKQSIYRFRRADVTVFRELEAQTKAREGLALSLEMTFRAHEPLLLVMEDLLRCTMETVDDPARPYSVPFQAMTAYHKEPQEGIRGPHAEFVYGAGSNAKTGRAHASCALAERLLELKDEGQIRKWDDVTLLFRASTGFAPFESAFEDANIPFVTVAGRGFYDRPEIRDVLNILRALSDPSDDLAMAGLLRSPAFGLTDAALYQLRQQSNPPAHYWTALHEDLRVLSEQDQERANRAVMRLEALMPLVDRIPVAELLKKLVDATDYRSILAIGDTRGASGRLWRNLDKLVGDAQVSRKVSVRDFLDYLATINDAGAKEGEAPAEAQGSVRLMTIHKSKGLQYPIIVFADASREKPNSRDSFFLLPELGLAFQMDPEPMLYHIAKQMDKAQNEAEAKRLLYVAFTRAQQKLIVCGHVTANKKGNYKAAAWLQILQDAIGIDADTLIREAGKEQLYQTASGQGVRAWALPLESGLFRKGEVRETQALEESRESPIFAPLLEEKQMSISIDQEGEIRNFRVTGATAQVSPFVVGKMVHKAIELWLFPGEPKLKTLLLSTAMTAGLARPAHQEAAIRETLELLGRLQASPLFSEMSQAEERFHELPYLILVGDHTENGYLDVLYRSPEGWQIVDFKSDRIANEEYRAKLLETYTPQVQRYSRAVESLLGLPVRARLCFLNDHGNLKWVEISSQNN